MMSIRRIHRLAPLLLVLAAVPGCGDDPADPAPFLKPNYAITHVNGVRVPCLLSEPDPYHIRIVAGQLRFLRGSGRWSGVWHLERWQNGPGPLCASSRAPATDAAAGGYLVAAGDIVTESQGSVTLAADSVWMSQDEPTSCGLFGCTRTNVVRGSFQFTAALTGDTLRIVDGVIGQVEQYRAYVP